MAIWILAIVVILVGLLPAFLRKATSRSASDTGDGGGAVDSGSSDVADCSSSDSGGCDGGGGGD